MDKVLYIKLREEIDVLTQEVIKLQEEKKKDLRDYFAGQALQGIMSNATTQRAKPEDITSAAYQMSDIMILERNK